DRRHRLHPDHQPARGRDPWRHAVAHAAGVGRRRLSAAIDDAAVAELRPPRDQRRRRRALRESDRAGAGATRVIMMTDELVLRTDADGVATLTLNRPEKR